MLTNYHTHTTYCDGNDTPETIALWAAQKGFDALGFSGHGYTLMDTSFCMRDTEGYRAEIRSLQQKYRHRMQIYLGVEEDMIHPVKREDFDYIIGSAHYIRKDGKYYSVDGGEDCYRECLALCGGDPIALAHAYYEPFCEYICKRKPDIVGHFDLLTKYDEKLGSQLLSDPEYLQVAKQYLEQALESDCIFEVNTGAVARGIRTTPYPCEELLHVMKAHDAKVILSSDCHNARQLDFRFAQTKDLLRDVGFQQVYVLYDGRFQPEDL